MYRYYNPDFLKNYDNVCIPRAFSLIFKDIEHDNIEYIKNNWKKILLDHGWEYISIPAKPFKKRMLVSELAEKNNKNSVIVCSCGNHVVCIIGNDYYDMFNSGDLCTFFYFKKGEYAYETI